MTKEELILWRKSRGMTQKQLADGLDIDIKTLGRWERGLSRMPMDILAKLELAAPGGMEKLRSNLPVQEEEMPFRWRPFPGFKSNRDYTGDEIDRLPIGTRVWILGFQSATEWTVNLARKKGHYISDEASMTVANGRQIRLTLPAGAFPDRLGPPAPWINEVYTANVAVINAARRELSAFHRELDEERAKRMEDPFGAPLPPHITE